MKKKRVSGFFEKKCETCNKGFSVYWSQYINPTIRFCSRPCKTVWQKTFKHTEDARQRIIKALIARPVTDESRRKNSKAKRGNKNYNYKGGYRNKNTQARHNVEFKIWRDKVYIRDNYTCKKCSFSSNFGDRSGLHPHHIVNFNQNKELRFVIENGVTFCAGCHLAFHRKYGMQNNNREQLLEYLNI